MAKLSSIHPPKIIFPLHGSFVDIAALLKPLSGRGPATADLFNNGRIEAIINNLSDDPMLLVNLTRNRNHWLDVHLVGITSNRDTIGACVTLHSGTRVWVDEVCSGSSYNSSSDLRIHF